MQQVNCVPGAIRLRCIGDAGTLPEAMVLTARTKRPSGKPLEIEPWDDARLRHAASRATYVGSPEHKSYTNPVTNEPPGGRPPSDASKCPRYPREAFDAFTASLREAILAGCVCGDDEGMPRYVFGVHEGRLFQARRRTDPPGDRYKGWWINDEEAPRDPEGRLDALGRRGGA